MPQGGVYLQVIAIFVMKNRIEFYVRPELECIFLDEGCVLCASEFGTEQMGDYNGTYDDWNLN